MAIIADYPNKSRAVPDNSAEYIRVATLPVCRTNYFPGQKRRILFNNKLPKDIVVLSQVMMHHAH